MDMSITERTGHLTSCPVCGHKSFQNVYRIEQPRPIDFVLCGYCSLIFQINPLSEADLNNYYQSTSVFHEHNPGSRTQIINLSRHKFIEEYTPNYADSELKRNIVDVGCGFGDFLSFFNPAQWNIIGLELNSQRARFAKREYGINVLDRKLENAMLESNSIDLLCSFGLLEHLEQPLPFLSQINRVLKLKGVGCINTPDVINPLVAISEFFSAEHILYFSENTLKRLLEIFGFEIIKTKRITLDYPDIACIFQKKENITSIKHLNYKPTENDDKQLIKESVSKYRANRAALLNNISEKLRITGALSDTSSTAIFGAGEHTKQLISAFPELNKVVHFFDNDPIKWGKSFRNGHIHPLDHINQMQINRIIISSKAFESEIIKKLSLLVNKEIQLIPLYSRMGTNDETL